MKILIDGQTLNTPDIYRGIGRYFINIINSILEYDIVDQFYITTSDEISLKHLTKYSQSKIIPIINSRYNSNTNTLNDYSDAINDKIIQLNIDLYWNPNPLMTNVFLPPNKSKAKFATTIFDLIPLVMKSQYFDKWPTTIANTYLNKINILKKNYELFFHISKNTKNDFLKYCLSPGHTHIVTYLAAEKTYKPDIFPITSSSEKYILYTGGFDPRKNMLKAIEAFSIFNSKLSTKKKYKLHIVCQLDQKSSNQLINYAKSLNCHKELVLTGFLNETELIFQYQKAALFFFPSLYEGFGLPILESLACGIPVVCSNNSSLPEIGQKHAFYFNANNPQEMAKALLTALDSSHSLASRKERYLYSQKFNWSATAQKTISSFHELIKSKVKTNKIQNKNKETIAWLSPLPPQKSGIANYSVNIINELKKYVNIDLYYDNTPPTPSIYKDFSVYPISDFEKKYHQYKNVYYHIGNSPQYHTNIYKLAWKYPGIVVLHDYNIQPFLEHAFLRNKEKSYFYDSLIEGYNLDENYVRKKTNHGVDPSLWQYPMSHALVNRSKKTIVHHLWAKNQFPNNKHILIIPHFAQINFTRKQKNINLLLKKYHLKKEEYLVTIAGYINTNKLPELSIKAIDELNKQGYPIKLIFAGELSPELMYLKKNANENTIFTDYQSGKDYCTTIHASDILINLRNPTMGEASGTLMQALAANKIAILSNLNQYKEFPDNVCPKITHDGKTELSQLVNIIKNIISNPNLVKEYQTNIYNFTKQYSIKNIVKQYLYLK